MKHCLLPEETNTAHNIKPVIFSQNTVTNTTSFQTCEFLAGEHKKSCNTHGHTPKMKLPTQLSLRVQRDVLPASRPGPQWLRTGRKPSDKSRLGSVWALNTACLTQTQTDTGQQMQTGFCCLRAVHGYYVRRCLPSRNESLLGK